MKPIGEPGVLIPSERYIGFPSEFARNNLFFLDQCGHYFLDHHYLISRSAPNEIRFLMMYVIKGELSLIIGGHDYIVRSNEIAIIDTRKYHIYASNGETEMLWIGFDGSSSEKLMEEIIKYGNVFVPVSLGNTLEPMREIIDAYKRKDPLEEEMVSAYIHLILADLLQRSRRKFGHKDAAIMKAAKHIQTHYQEQLTLDELADIACLNASYFSTKFKKVLGESPKEYLLNTRMRAAKILLLETTQSVQQIAANTGFQNDAYFSSFFKRKIGIPPGEWRNQS